MAQAPRRPAAPARPAARQAPAKAAPAEPEGNGATQMPMTITATTTNPEHKGRKITVEYDFGQTLDDSVELFGENVVHGVFIDQAVIRLQSMLRRCIADGVAEKDVQAKVDAWKMTVGGRERKSAGEKVKGLFEKMTAEQRRELLKELRG